jgi:hypothetical protein
VSNLVSRAENRIPALETAVSSYSFLLSDAGGQVIVTTELKFRRLFQPLADQKGWQVPDFLLGESSAVLIPSPIFGSYLPTISSR